VTITVHPASADRWEDLAEVMGTRGDPSRCWCQFFRLRGADLRKASVSDRRAMLHDQVSGSPPPGVIAYRDEVPAGWCAVAPKASYDRLLASPIADASLGETTVWAVTCFVVRVGHRRKGVAGALLDGAVALAREHGASTVEAYPVDPSARAAVTAADLYHGPLPLFIEAGFVEVRRPYDARPVVRLDLPH
jgi:GNAT superfamily N-acetyltransferase